MSKYLTIFDTEAAYNAASENLDKPNVSYIKETEDVMYLPMTVYENEYLTLNIISAGTITWKASSTSSSASKTISYSLDNGQSWTDLTSISYGVSISVGAGDKVLLKGNNDQYSTLTYNNTFAGSTAYFDVEGNIMSLVNADNFATATTFASGTDNNFKFLFAGTNVINAENLILPVQTMTDYCYEFMFLNCPLLEAAPAIKATTASASGCCGMFSGCTSLEKAPALPATTLDRGSYYQMFKGCTGLTAAPELPATTLAESCYNRMFAECASLTTAPELPATTLANYCYSYMFADCINLTTAPELPATTLANYCYSYMFYGCIGLTSAPQLPAATLTQNAYNAMFAFDSQLSQITCLATNISATNCTKNWLEGVSENGTFTKDASMTGWTTGVDGIPTNWAVVDYSA